jgi:hypothetical protein
VIDCVRLFDALYDLLSDPGQSAKDREREKVRQTNDGVCVCVVCDLAVLTLLRTPRRQSALVMSQLRQVGHELRDAMTGHWALNTSVSTDEVLREITPEEVGETRHRQCVVLID